MSAIYFIAYANEVVFSTARAAINTRRINMYKKILLATDGSLHSLRAADNAMKIAAYDPNTLIVIVYALESDHVKAEVLLHWNSRFRRCDLG